MKLKELDLNLAEETFETLLVALRSIKSTRTSTLLRLEGLRNVERKDWKTFQAAVKRLHDLVKPKYENRKDFAGDKPVGVYENWSFYFDSNLSAEEKQKISDWVGQMKLDGYADKLETILDDARSSWDHDEHCDL